MTRQHYKLLAGLPFIIGHSLLAQWDLVFVWLAVLFFMAWSIRTQAGDGDG